MAKKNILPPKPLKEMSAEELKAYFESLNHHLTAFPPKKAAAPAHGEPDDHSDGPQHYATPADALIVDAPKLAPATRGKGSEIANQWWGRSWLEALKPLDEEGRLQRGRTYARNGSVRRLEISRGLAFAKVQGSMPRPYLTRVRIAPFSDAEWHEALAALGSQATYTAKLLAGVMPPEIEQVFNGVGLSLFPKEMHDIKYDCDCLDYGEPCKHCAAVYYLLADQIDRDPFVLFHLRGRTREQILDVLRLRRTQQVQPVAVEQSPSATPTEQPVVITKPFVEDLTYFWQVEAPANITGELSKATTPLVFQKYGNPPGDAAIPLRKLYAFLREQAVAILVPDEMDDSNLGTASEQADA